MRSPRQDTGPPGLTTPEGFGVFHEEHIGADLGFVTRRVADPHLAADLVAGAAGRPRDLAVGARRDHVEDQLEDGTARLHARPREAGGLAGPVHRGRSAGDVEGHALRD
ncbi:RNA polymerase subunit sigma, partial [Streptomyces sp. NPDC054946]